MQTKNLTIMFTDMKGFTAKTSVGSRNQIEHLLDLHDNMIRPIFKQFGGVVVKTIGDAFLVTFESPTDAVLAGMKIQEAVQNHNVTAASDDRFEVRVAINSGEVHLKEDDVFGEPVNIAARIESIAEPGEVYFTEAVYLAMNRNEIPSSEVGHRHLKGIPEQIKVYKVLQEQTNLIRERIKRQQAAAKSANLPKDEVVTGVGEKATEEKAARGASGAGVAAKSAVAGAAAGASSKSAVAAGGAGGARSADQDQDNSQKSWWARNAKVIVAVVITVLITAVVVAALLVVRARKNENKTPKTDTASPTLQQDQLRRLAPQIENRIKDRLNKDRPATKK